MKRAFSLIEVLIAILVLALGLLGLGAIFPAVISEQRRAFDSISGETVAKIAEDILRSGTVVNTSDLRGPDLGRVERVQAIGGDGLGRPTQIHSAIQFEYIWVMDDFVQIDGAPVNWPANAPVPGARSFNDFLTGAWWANTRAPGGQAQRQQILPVSARLHPQPYSGAEPRFVWDAVARRHPSGSVQIGVFVRRIDDRIRVPSGVTLSDVLTGNNTPFQLPLALDIPTGRLVAPQPNASNLAYPPPQALQAYVDERRLDWLILEADPDDSGVDTSIGFVRRVGQQLLDNTGVVRTVVGIPQPGPGEPMTIEAQRAIVVDPPFTRAEASNGRTVNSTSTSPEAVRQKASWVRQIVFTPQPPVAVRVFSLDQE
ncbi:MAG: prepilin-type N-terminal cleavage/methylation domain-containing protein [Phycisphaerales bacterium]|nr:prepilin-type N-terminal cleavage/methylation domain-containing protein [Planctomycetota bacterium]MCH8507810.1 prepilin-type N-terminal cleavage/methylation domain-containing protein [Phycisphaerales bacterium]